MGQRIRAGRESNVGIRRRRESVPREVLALSRDSETPAAANAAISSRSHVSATFRELNCLDTQPIRPPLLPGARRGHGHAPASPELSLPDGDPKEWIAHPRRLHRRHCRGRYRPRHCRALQIASVLVRKKLLTKFQAMQLLNGRTRGFVLGQYKILDGIRQDRVGMVFAAEDTETNQRVAIKVLPSDRASDPTILKAFMHEVRAAREGPSSEPGSHPRYRLLARHALRRLGVRGWPLARQDGNGPGSVGPSCRRPAHCPGGRWSPRGPSTWARAPRCQTGQPHRDAGPQHQAH